MLKSWEEAQERGLTQAQHAVELGIKYTTYKNRIFVAQHEIELGQPAFTGESLEEHQYGNNWDLESKGERIQTLEQLLEACRVDMETWYVDHWVANKWEVGAKDSDDVVQIHPLFQVKAWLKRWKIEPVEYAVQPVALRPARLGMRKIAGEKIARMELSLFDTHFGFSRDFQAGTLNPHHDRQALDLVVRIARRLQPDTITLGGDIFDFGEMSEKFIRSPDMYFVVQPALVEFVWWASRLRKAAPGAQVDFIEGNHELRMQTAMLMHVPWAYDLREGDNLDGLPVMSVPRLAALDRLGITWHGDYPQNPIWRGEALRIVHGDVARKPPGATSRAIVEESPENTLFGHIHRRELATENKRTREGDRCVSALCPGGLMRLDGSVPGHRPLAQHWQQGFGLTWYGDDWSDPQAVAIQAGRCVACGEVFEGQDYTEQLREETEGKWGF